MGKSEKRSCGTLKEKLVAVQPQLDELRKKNNERLKLFADVKMQIQKVLIEISSSSQVGDAAVFATARDTDLSMGRLDEYHAHLQALQKEKAERLQKVANYVAVIHDLCAVIGVDFLKMVTNVHPSLVKTSAGHSKSISDTTLDRLRLTV